MCLQFSLARQKEQSPIHSALLCPFHKVHSVSFERPRHMHLSLIRAASGTGSLVLCLTPRMYIWPIALSMLNKNV
jgi:hypothetical protein